MSLRNRDPLIEARIELGLVEPDDIAFYEAGINRGNGWPAVWSVTFSGRREMVWCECSISSPLFKMRQARRMAKRYASANRRYPTKPRADR